MKEHTDRKALWRSSAWQAEAAEWAAGRLAAAHLAPLRRSRAVINNFDHAGADDKDDLGPTPWTWLTLTSRAPT